MAIKKYVQRLFIFLMVSLVVAQAKASKDPEIVRQLQGVYPGTNIDPSIFITQGNQCNVQDPNYYDLSIRSRIADINKDRYKNSVALIVREEIIGNDIYVPNDFTYTIKVNITWYDLNEVSHTVSNINLTVSYTKAAGAKYDARQYYYLNDARRVDVTITELPPPPTNGAWDPRTVLTLENRLIAYRDYKFNDPPAVPSVNFKTSLTDELNINWYFPPDKGATHFDVEWAWIDEESIENYKSNDGGTMRLDPDLIFKRNSTRITIPITNNCNIPLLYDGNGFLYYRIRAMQYTEDGRILEGGWSLATRSGAEDPINYFSFAGHELNQFNWQASTTFAEDGKRKTVIQYFDGTLRSRQTVTKDNSTAEKNTVVAETLYDYQGRPSINILPAPTLNTVLGYARNFNRFIGQGAAQHPKDIYDALPEGQTQVCNSAPAALDNTQGTAQYYSPNNQLPVAGANAFNKYIPDAFGFPYTETRYVPDGTGRIAEQSGVGPQHQLNSGHQTKYFYGGVYQEEIDGLFGLEAGYASHYFKNMVVDANGQVSVSYTDMHGRTVATALAGEAPASLTALPSKPVNSPVVVKNLLTAENNLVQGRSVVASTTLLVSAAALHTFNYNLSPQSAMVTACTPPGEQVCYDCYYTLQIKITDQCGNVIKDKTWSNITFNNGNPVYGTNCSPQGISFTMPEANEPNILLQTGEYNITKTLTVDKGAQDWYRENVFKTKLDACKTLEQLKTEVLTNLMATSDCATMTCASCTTAVGSDFTIYKNKYLTALGLPLNTVLPQEKITELENAYKEALDNCLVLCNTNQTELDIIEQEMLDDMVPGSGQYAQLNQDLDGDGNIGGAIGVVPDQMYENGLSRPFNIMGNQPYPVATHIPSNITAPFFLRPADANGAASEYKLKNNSKDNAAYKQPGNTQVIDNVDDFAAAFNENWAKSLLYYHPEYPKFQYAKQHLAASYQFSAALQDVETWEQAQGLNYIVSNLTNADPFYTGPGIGYKQQMDDFITLSYTYGNGTTPPTQSGSFWKLAYAAIACLNNDQINCLNGAPSGPNHSDWVSLVTSRCTADKDYMWQIFKALYLSVKNNHVNQFLSNQVPQSVYTVLKNNNYQRRFGEFDEFANPYTIIQNVKANGDIEDVKADAQAELNIQYAANCNSYIQFWKNELEECRLSTIGTNQVLTPAIITQITNALEQICIKGSDEEHPLGSSSVKPGLPNTYLRFEEAIAAILSSHNIDITALCHPFLISYPRPYEAQPPVGDGIVTLKKDVCVCSNLTAIKNKMVSTGYISDIALATAENMSLFLFQRFKISITEAVLTTLLSGCDPAAPADCATYNPPIEVPGFLTACKAFEENCIECAAYEALRQQFITAYPVFSGVPYLTPANQTEIDQNKAFAAFLNNKTGLNKTWMEYADFHDRCNQSQNNTAAAVNEPIRLCGMIEPPKLPELIVEGPCDFLNEMALQIATHQYNAWIRIQNDRFDETYLSRCLQARNYETFTVSAQQSEYHFTLYYYDQAGNLVKTVPPQGVQANFSLAFTAQVEADRLAGNPVVHTGSNANVPAHNMVTQYRYNSLNQVVAQISPDGGLSHFWYDRLGRLIISQNAKQFVQGKYSYTLYDALGRIKEVGQKPNEAPDAEAIKLSDANYTSWLYNGASNKEQITRTTYDVIAENLNTDLPTYTQHNLRNRVSYTQVFDTDPDPVAFPLPMPASYGHNSATYYTYDIHGNVDVLLQDYKALLGDLNNRFKIIKYRYDLISGKVNEVAYQPGMLDGYMHHYEYDAENKLTEVLTSRDAEFDPNTGWRGGYWEREAGYKYYRHGPLARSVLGQLQVQGLDYAYTLQGWLKGVNSTAINGNTDMGGDGTGSPYVGAPLNPVARDAYSYSLNYFYNDYKHINSSAITPFADILDAGNISMPILADGVETGHTLYNGNIAAMFVNIPKLGNAQAYGYRYDQLNRIKAMNAYSGFNNTNNSFTATAVEAYKERVSYDANGNIVTYQRNSNAARPGAMDDMQYRYWYINTSGTRQQYNPAQPIPGNAQTLTNQLAQVEDAATDVAATDYDKYNDIKQGQVNGNYQYDKIGNLISDASEGITNIEWNVYGKIKRIVKADPQTSAQTIINYKYDAAGNRIAKKVQNGDDAGNGGITTIYLRDASGNVMSLYSLNTPAFEGSATLYQTEVHLYGSSRLGIVNTQLNVADGNLAVPTEGITTFTRGSKLFELSNHLGNVLVTISDKKLLVIPGDDGSGCLPGTGVNILNVYTRNTTITNYVARQEVNLWPDFENPVPDEYTVYTDANLPECVPITSQPLPPGSYYSADVITANDYYPGGMNMPGRKFVSGNSGYRYGFNGKEKSDEIYGEGNTYNFDARMYDSRVVRWFSTDAKDKPHLTPYNFVQNNLPNKVDPDGNDDIHFHFTKQTIAVTIGKGASCSTSYRIVHTASIEVIKTNGPDKFFHHKHVLGLGGYKSEKITEFHPFEESRRSGLTTTPMPFTFGLITRDDRDVHTLAKYYDASPAFKDYLDKRLTNPKEKYTQNWYNYRDIFFPNRANFNAWGTVSSASEKIANVLMLVYSGVGLMAGGLDATATSFSIASSAGGATAPMKLVRIIGRGEKIEDIVNSAKGLTWTTGNEHALVKLANGERALVSGGPGGISFKPGEIQKLFGHTHPTSAGASSEDFSAVSQLGQTKQYVLHGGEVTVVRPK